MADNLDITAGSGTTIATDQVGTDHFQKIKLADGTADSSTMVAVDIGAKANALRVAPANDVTDATYIGDIKFGEAEPNSAAIAASLAIIDDWDDSDYCNVNCNIAGTDMVGGAGAVAAGVQRVTLASDDPSVALLTTIDSDTSAVKTAIELLDNAVDGNYLNVNLNLAGTDADSGEGVLTANTLRVSLATDDDGVAHLATIAGDTTSLDGKVTACNTGAVVLAASDGTDIGNVDVASVIPGTGATNLGKAIDSASGANDVGVATLAVRDDALSALTPVEGDWVPLRVNSTGALHVTGGGGGTQYNEDDAVPANPTGTALLVERDDALGGIIPAAGDWTQLFCDANGALWTHDDALDAALSGSELQVDVVASLPAGDNNIGNVDIASSVAIAVTDNDSTLSIDDGNGTITVDQAYHDNLQCNANMQVGDSDASGGEGTIDATTLRVTIATDDDGVAHLATIAGDTTAIETAVQIMDDWDAVHDSAASSDGPQVMAAYDSTKPTAVADGDAVRVLADSYGRLLSGVEPTRFQAVYDSADATGEGEVVQASAASTVIVIQSYIISSDVEGWIKLQDEDSTALTGKFWLKAGGGVAITLPDNAPIVLGADKDLEVICEAAGNVSVSATGYTIPG